MMENLRVTDDNDIIKLQAALDSLSNWAESWQLTVSVEKCFVLNIGNVVIQPRLSINGILPPMCIGKFSTSGNLATI